jgi:hypothetical protein
VAGTHVPVRTLPLIFFLNGRALYIEIIKGTTKLIQARSELKVEPRTTMIKETPIKIGCQRRRTQSKPARGFVENTDDVNLQGASNSLANRRADGSTSNRDGEDRQGQKMSCRYRGCNAELNTEESSPLNLGSYIGDDLNCLRRIHPSDKKKAKTT